MRVVASRQVRIRKRMQKFEISQEILLKLRQLDVEESNEPRITHGQKLLLLWRWVELSSSESDRGVWRVQGISVRSSPLPFIHLGWNGWGNRHWCSSCNSWNRKLLERTSLYIFHGKIGVD